MAQMGNAQPMVSQLTFNLPIDAEYRRDNFIVSASNKEAFFQVTNAWNSHALLLNGRIGSGKTHLSHIWASEQRATQYNGSTLPSPDQINSHLLIENIELCSDETALFHLINHCKEQAYKLLLTSEKELGELQFTLPDLSSRIRALPIATIHAPDDVLLAACIRKQFADRQLEVSEDVIAFIVTRMERSFVAASAMVELIDQAALSEHKKITIPFIKKQLG